MRSFYMPWSSTENTEWSNSDMSARLYSARPQQLLEVCRRKENTQHVHTRSHSHTWHSHLNIKGWDEKKRKNNNFQRASEGFGCLFVFLRLVSFSFLEQFKEKTLVSSVCDVTVIYRSQKTNQTKHTQSTSDSGTVTAKKNPSVGLKG